MVTNNMSKKKNISQKIKNGTIVQTRDEYFKGQSNYRKPNYSKKGNYRKAVVVDSNSNDELALVKIISSGRINKFGKHKTRPHILTKDDDLKPIKESKKFIINRRKRTGEPREKISQKEANEIKRLSIKDKKHGKVNIKRLKELKKRHNNKKEP